MVLDTSCSQLRHLKRARRWFIDGTFKVVSRPFYQLMSVHAFVTKDDNIKQVPLLFVLMSRRQKRDYIAKVTKPVPLSFMLIPRRQTEDYRAVFEALMKKIQPEELNVEWFMIDYEAAAWQAIRHVFQRALIRGCVFHWTQRIYRKVMQLGLSGAYNQGGDTYGYIRKVMALAYLPAEHIREAFQQLRTLAQHSSGPVQSLNQYVESTWINGAVWRPENWSIFRETVRTNNDVEGWHRGLNSRANGNTLPFYVIVHLLKDEAEDVNITVRLVSEQMVSRCQRDKYKRIHGQLFKMWDSYETEDNFSTSRLLREASHIVGLGPTINTAEDHGDDE